MSQDYEYAGEPLSELATMDLLKNRYTVDDAIKKGHTIESLMYIVEKDHVEKGGLPTDDHETLRPILRKTLRFLSNSGHAIELLGGNWRLSKSDQRIFGRGQHWVYLYYFEEDKHKAESQERTRWRCRIGKADKDPEGRITRPTKGTPIPPRIALLFRTDKHTELEGAIHRILKLRGQYLEKLQGASWFDTTPAEVSKIYDFIIHGTRDYTRRMENRYVRKAKRAHKRLLESQSCESP